MNRCDDLVVIGCVDITILDKQVLGILREVRGCEDAKGGCAIVLEESRARPTRYDRT